MDNELANTIPIFEILGKLHLEPTRIHQHIAEYPSPFVSKRKSLFSINTLTNRWSDVNHQDRTLVDFVCQYLKYRWEEHTEADALRWIKNMMVSFPRQLSYDPIADIPDYLELRHKKSIQYPGLVHYLQRQKIALPLARQHLKEIHARNQQTGKEFIALGLHTIEGGFELRTAYLERSIGMRSISFIRGTVPKPNAIHVFKEGMDYLSLLTRLNLSAFNADVIILNAWSCLPQVAPYIRQYGYRKAYSWLDNTEAGAQATASLARFIKTEDNLHHEPMNKLYVPHMNVHAWHMHTLNLTL